MNEIPTRLDPTRPKVENRIGLSRSKLGFLTLGEEGKAKLIKTPSIFLSKAPTKPKEGDIDRSSRSNKHNHGENGGHSWRIPWGYESSGRSYLTDKHTPKRGRAAGDQCQSKIRNRDNRFERANLAQQDERTNNWYDDVPDTPFVDTITLINTPSGFAAPKLALYGFSNKEVNRFETTSSGSMT
ncbi:hypothetical protein FNV43_RR02414 [Rhamnella rubrinervis]|uniref:Uncharacterized protein n=1 Tax=Rhamnella rubrinervis TaxID=2594499 RepID=A0A8K0HTI6_9ROSA|nr:hypothetical protein FNV43_RR02414 [Rhamnella rubrinervis]